jgi:raffinose/stachyose/melibiose transport system substrate-binding protein
VSNRSPFRSTANATRKGINMLSSKTHLRISAAVFAAMITATTLAGCSTAGASSDENVLTVGTNGGGAMNGVIAAFEEEHPGVTVEVRDSPENYQQVTATQLTGGTAPDVVQVFPGTGNNLSVKIAGDKGFFADVSDEDWGPSIPGATRDLLSTSEGELVAVPMTFSSIGGIYNQGVIDELGLAIPTTWSEVLQFCADAADDGKVAYGLGLSDTWTTQLIPYALTATLVYAQNPDFAEQQVGGTATFAESGWQTALEQYVEMDEAGCFNTSPNGTPYSEVQDGIRNGDTLATVSVAAETNAIAATGPDGLVLTYAAFPATDDSSETYLSATIGPSFAINAKTDKLDLAKEFLAFLASPETQVKYADLYGDTAALPGDATQDSQVAELVTSYVTENKISTWPDQLWPSTTVQPALFDGVQAIFSGQDDIDGVLAKMDAAFSE